MCFCIMLKKQDWQMDSQKLTPLFLPEKNSPCISCTCWVIEATIAPPILPVPLNDRTGAVSIRVKLFHRWVTNASVTEDVTTATSAWPQLRRHLTLRRRLTSSPRTRWQEHTFDSDYRYLYYYFPQLSRRRLVLMEELTWPPLRRTVAV